MNTIVIDKDNTVKSFQKILKLISVGKRLEVRVQPDQEQVFNEAVKSNKIRSKLSILASKL
jgi:hypothetical protein